MQRFLKAIGHYRISVFASTVSIFFLMGNLSCGPGLITQPSTSSVVPTPTVTPTPTPSPTPVPLTYSTSIPTSSRTIWVDDEIAMRTITLTHNADTIECSRNNGTSYGACDTTTSIVWTTAAYSTAHKVRFNKAGVTSQEYTFTPSSLFSGVSFVTCTATVSANTNFDTFRTTYAGTASGVVCINNGVTISNTGANSQISFSANNILIIGRHNQTATFSSTSTANPPTGDSVFDVSNQSGIKFVGLTVSFASTSGTSYLLKASGTSQSITIDSCTLSNTATGSSAYVVYARGGLSSGTPLAISNSTISAGTGVGIHGWNGVFITMTNSTLTGTNELLNPTVSASIALTNSTITSSGATGVSIPINMFNGGIVTLTSSTVVDGSGNGTVILDGATANSITITNSTIKRSTLNSGTTGPIFKSNGGSAVHEVSQTGTNVFCNVAVSPAFTALSAVTGGGFLAVPTGSIVTCP